MDIKRRDLFTGGLAGAALVALPQRAAAAVDTGMNYPVGDFVLSRTEKGLSVTHKQTPDRVLWATQSRGNFLAAEEASAAVTEVGSPEGTFKINDTVTTRYESPTIDDIQVAGSAATVSGTISGPADSVAYTLVFSAVSPTHLQFAIKLTGDKSSSLNRVVLAIDSSKDEAIFGCGSQLTYFNQKGKLVPILVQEHGIGRGKPIVTELVNLLDYDSGGTPFHTGKPVPYIMTSRLRCIFLEDYEYSEFDMRKADAIQIKIWSGKMSGRILYGKTPVDLLEAYTEYTGRMRKLPEWVHSGIILGIMGGTDKVRERIQRTKDAGVPVAGLWLQDWVGTHPTSAGTQLFWNWFLDEAYYPGWRQLVDDIAKDGGKILTYINPFLATIEGHDQLFQEGKAKGYLVQHADGSPYLIKNANFMVGMIDLSNPATRSWIKNVMKTNMVGTGAGGWMNDFGEALPLDAKLYGGADPWVWHNKFPEEWQRLSREVIDETGHGDEMVFFSRSGYTRSPGISTLFWLGDQLMTWDEYDGIKTALVGILSGGISGFSMMHSDIGGYVALKLDIAGKEIPIINRTPELMMRWMELNAFTAVMRTQEGITPNLSIEADSTPEMLEHLRLCGAIYRALTPYRKSLVDEANGRGLPLVRHLFLHYPDDPNTHDIRYQFLLGEDLMVAPVLDKGADSVEVYFPTGSAWNDAWTGKDAGQPGEWARMPAPLGKPAVFIRKGSPDATALATYLKDATAAN
ncbi:alpha-glucosidase [Flaviflagellibacter deserti]|uniref:Alpha-glucosidase n=1 Tax=Flaviflagellibacter deserti TaxID=2267266 RepID=A0ABV9YVB0_9HYPH